MSLAFFSGARKNRLIAGVAFTFAIGASFALGFHFWGVLSPEKPKVTKKLLSDAVRKKHAKKILPSEVDINLGEKQIPSVVQYSFDPELQQAVEALYDEYRPEYGAFVAMDASTGRILAMVSHTKDPELQDENLALRATYPSASVFKVVTAAAAISKHVYSAESVIPFNGRNHTLYRKQIINDSVNRWTRHITLREAFGRSVNTVFGKIGAFAVGTEDLKDFAFRFGFNQPLPVDLPVEEGRAPIPSDSWGLAETASGFTRDNQMSPVQGAMIAAAIVNDGVAMEPYAIDRAVSRDGKTIYVAQPKVIQQVIDPQTAFELRRLMQETVYKGTSKKFFRGFFKGNYSLLEVGGKTGTLNGENPKGLYDWFVGYADGFGQRIAIAALSVHDKVWRAKSSYLARRAIEVYFHRSVQDRNVAKRHAAR